MIVSLKNNTYPITIIAAKHHSIIIIKFYLCNYSLLQHATINGDTVTVGMGYKEPRSVKILFDECFYNSSDESYQVFCLEQPMEGGEIDLSLSLSLSLSPP